MAKATIDFMRTHRFHPQFGVQGASLGLSKVDVEPDGALVGPGWVHLTAALHPDFVRFLQESRTEPLCIGLFGMKDDIDKSVMSVLLDGVQPSAAHLAPLSLDATSSENLNLTVKLRYTALRFVLGNSPLSYLAAVAEDEQR